MNLITASSADRIEMFSILSGWTSQFVVDGKPVGGTTLGLTTDDRMIWHMEQIGGVRGKRILELGPLEGHHTKMLCEGGANVIAVEGLSECFLRCLIVKEAFGLNARFLFGDFCRYVENCDEMFDAVLAAGVLYHQRNPAKVINDLARITGAVMVWSHVASGSHPNGAEDSVSHNAVSYRGRINNYVRKSRASLEGYCGGLNNEAFWMYPEDMRKCFRDAGFSNLTELPQAANQNGDALLFFARK